MTKRFGCFVKCSTMLHSGGVSLTASPFDVRTFRSTRSITKSSVEVTGDHGFGAQALFHEVETTSRWLRGTAHCCPVASCGREGWLVKRSRFRSTGVSFVHADGDDQS